MGSLLPDRHNAVFVLIEELVRRLHLHLQLLELRCKLLVLVLVVLQLLGQRNARVYHTERTAATLLILLSRLLLLCKGGRKRLGG